MLADGAVGGVGRLHSEDDLGALLAADLVDDLADLEPVDLDRLAALLGDGDDLVVGLQFASQIGRAAGNDLLNDADVVLDAQQGADAHELQLHLDAEVLVGGGGEIGGVRVVESRDAGQKHLREVVALDLAEVLQHAFVALAHLRPGVFRGLLCQDLLNDFELQAPAPQVVGRRRVRGPGGLLALAVDTVGLARGEVQVLRQFRHDPLQSCPDPLVVDIEDLVGRVDVAEKSGVVEHAFAELVLEPLPVTAEEEESLAVEVAHEVRDHLREVGVVHRVAVVVQLGQQLDEGVGLGGQGRRRRELPAVGGGPGRRGGQEQEQQRGRQAADEGTVCHAKLGQFFGAGVSRELEAGLNGDLAGAWLRRACVFHPGLGHPTPGR